MAHDLGTYNGAGDQEELQNADYIFSKAMIGRGETIAKIARNTVAGGLVGAQGFLRSTEEHEDL